MASRQPIEDVTIIGSQGARLAAELHRPPEQAKGSVLLASASLAAILLPPRSAPTLRI